MSNSSLDSPDYYNTDLSNSKKMNMDMDMSLQVNPTDGILTPDNYFMSCPNTTDGRSFTDFKTPTQRNEYIKYINNIWRDDNYRVFLQSNASQIMDREFHYNKKVNKCVANTCIHNSYPLRSLPQDYANQMNAYNNRYIKDTGHPHTTRSGVDYQEHSGKNCESYEGYRLHPDSNKRF